MATRDINIKINFPDIVTKALIERLRTIADELEGTRSPTDAYICTRPIFHTCHKDYPDTIRIPYGFYTNRRVAQRIAEAQIRRAGIAHELKVTDRLLEERNTVINAIPECPSHGPQCIPHCLRWVIAARKALKEECTDEEG